MKTIAQQLNITKFPFEIMNKNNNLIYYEDINGFWYKWEFDEKANIIYSENSDGIIEDNRPQTTVELTLDEIAVKFGINVKDLKIKK